MILESIFCLSLITRLCALNCLLRGPAFSFGMKLVHLLGGLIRGINFAEFLVQDFLCQVVVIDWHSTLLERSAYLEIRPLQRLVEYLVDLVF